MVPVTAIPHWATTAWPLSSCLAQSLDVGCSGESVTKAEVTAAEVDLFLEDATAGICVNPIILPLAGSMSFFGGGSRWHILCLPQERTSLNLLSFFWVYVVIRPCFKIQKTLSISLCPIQGWPRGGLWCLVEPRVQCPWSLCAEVPGHSDFHRSWHIVGVKTNLNLTEDGKEQTHCRSLSAKSREQGLRDRCNVVYYS